MLGRSFAWEKAIVGGFEEAMDCLRNANDLGPSRPMKAAGPDLDIQKKRTVS